MDTLFVDDHVSPSKEFVRYVPGSLQAFQRAFIYDEIRRNQICDGYFRRVFAAKNSHSQLAGLFTNLVEVRAIVKQCPALELARTDCKHRDPCLSSNRDDCIDANAECDVAPNPQRFSPPSD